ncbi:hypothetical protein CERSUDRAFT_85972 [Gelatoporia subvermispora B]|uniref:Uncharacterized protein n=1 Tax=Ceriporiopsis subvermispora (strain B) TaxID=914234 RepID=M2QC46_CERS8|nr:hypothetical protein CERSUDRAFT_85972 [Gelatoporia subvermispora B]
MQAIFRVFRQPGISQRQETNLSARASGSSCGMVTPSVLLSRKELEKTNFGTPE